MKTIFNEVVDNLKELIINFPYNVYAVGGCVRDLLLGEDPDDIDLVVDAPNGDQEIINFLKENYPDRINGLCEFGKFNTARFNLILTSGKTIQLDVAMTRVESYHRGYRKPDEVGYASVEEDSKRRDFCLNAMYYDIKRSEILDPTGFGKKDLENKILRTPLDPKETFEEDSLRMLRALRFEACKKFKVDDAVFAAIQQASESIKSTPKERIQKEIDKLMMCSDPVNGIRRIHESGLLGYIIPELENSWGMDQHSKYHNLTFTDHSLKVLELVVKNNPNANLELRWAALLHDIAKPTCYTVKEDGFYSYIGHDILSANLAEEILRRLKFSSDFCKKVRILIASHMIIKNNWDGKSLKAKDSKIRNVSRILGENLKEAMELIDADNNAHHPDHCLPGQVNQFFERLSGLKMADYSIDLLSGNEIQKLLNIKPCKVIKMIKSLIDEWRDANPDLTKEMAIDLIQKKQGFKKIVLDLIAENAIY